MRNIEMKKRGNTNTEMNENRNDNLNRNVEEKDLEIERRHIANSSSPTLETVNQVFFR